MSDYIVKDTELTSVANAIRIKGGTNSQLVFPGGFVNAIGNISGGGGSSDFSTAEVTFSVVNGSANAPTGVIIDTTDALSYTSGDAANDDDKFVYVLYKGSQTVSASDIAQITVEGNANIVEQVEDDGYWYAMINITGNCTINLTGGGEV